MIDPCKGKLPNMIGKNAIKEQVLVVFVLEMA
jgi:hypothetical protein